MKRAERRGFYGEDPELRKEFFHLTGPARSD